MEEEAAGGEEEEFSSPMENWAAWGQLSRLAPWFHHCFNFMVKVAKHY